MTENAQQQTQGARDAYRDQLTHVDEHGDVRMVDVSDKATTKRIAVAEGTILMHPETQAMILEDRAKKGDVLACARVAGIMASKHTSDLIPMCHPLMITKAKVEIEPIAALDAACDGVVPQGWSAARSDGRVGFHVMTTCGVTGVTGIEMEALTAASIACLTIYDMCKAVDRGMEIVDVRLLHKEGGRSGVWDRMTGAKFQVSSAETHQTFNETLDSSKPTLEHSLSRMSAQQTVPVLAFVGYHDSGKTTVLEKVVKQLTEQGVRVGTIKHHGHADFDIDVPGKDSWRMQQAGSQHVGLICQDRYAEYAASDHELLLEEMLGRFTDVDIVLVEGYKNAELPNIVIARSGVDRMRGDDSLNLVNDQTIAVAANDGLMNRMHANLPEHIQLLNLNNIEDIVSLVIQRL